MDSLLSSRGMGWMNRKFLATALGTGALFLVSSSSYGATTLCGTVTAIASSAHNWINALGTNCTFTQTQPAVTDLANIGGGTVVGNPTGSAATPSATTAPVLGIGGTSAGTEGFSSATATGVVTVANQLSPNSYNFNLPSTAGTSGQALVSSGGGSIPMNWATIATAQFTVTSETTGFAIPAGTADATRYDNRGASVAITGTLPASGSVNVGDNWCFLVAAAQNLVVLANTGESIDFGGVTSTPAGAISSNTSGSAVCMYFETTTAVYAWAAQGPWTITN